MAKQEDATSQSNDRKRPSTNNNRKVQVFACPSDFPTPFAAGASSSTGRPTKRQRPDDDGMARKSSQLLDWNETTKEIRNFGANGFVGKKKREFEDEAYKRLTGRERKRHKVPLPIVRGIKKKAAQRRARELEEARQAGIVLPTSNEREDKSQRKRKDVARIHGPAPSVGFLTKGMLRVHKPT